MTQLFGWCFPIDNHHFNDGSPGECPGVSASDAICACPCHTDPQWQPEPPFRRIRIPSVVIEIADMEPDLDIVDDEPDGVESLAETDEL